MPHFPSTPEALVARNDSKNPNSTCHGITSSGRPCRRALASRKSTLAVRSSSENKPSVKGQARDVANYCWQHKDQAERVLWEKKEHGVMDKDQINAGRNESGLHTLRETSSIDTLMQKLEIQGQVRSKRREPPGDRANEEDAVHPKNKEQPTMHSQRRRRSDLRDNSTQNPTNNRQKLQPPSPKKESFWRSLCCMIDQAGDDDYLEVVRHRKRTYQQRPDISTAAPDPAQSPPARPKVSTRPTSMSLPSRKHVPSTLSMRPRDQRSTSNPHTTQLLSYIPPHLPPTATSALMAELVKPISVHDEDGYIYIFWLTPQNRSSPSEQTARSLLSTPARPDPSRRISNVMTEFSYDGAELECHTDGFSRPIRTHDGQENAIMLKIGRANNVTRRLNEWQRQCGYALTLVRWYPYISSSAAISGAPASPPRESSHQPPLYPDLTAHFGPMPDPNTYPAVSLVRKVPFVKRVERLIHIELADKQIKRQCAACGKEHREWFETEASQSGIEGIDKTIRRWVSWAEKTRGRDVVM